MAIGFARVEFVKRTDGKNACIKAAYNSRSKIIFNGNSVSDPDVYDWSNKESPSYHEITLPEGADKKFKSPETLWNAVEAKEKKCNAVVATELLLALPDDKVISLEDRIHLTKTFVQTHFIDKGLAAQIDIHPPEKRVQIMREDRENGLFKGMIGNITEEKEDSDFLIDLAIKLLHGEYSIARAIKKCIGNDLSFKLIWEETYEYNYNFFKDLLRKIIDDRSLENENLEADISNDLFDLDVLKKYIQDIEILIQKK